MDFRDELVAMGHEARTFAYRRDNPLYKNRSTKATYQLFILRRLERACVAYRPDFVLVIKGGPQVEVLNGVSLHGGLVVSWPVVSPVTAAMTVQSLVAHWRKVGVRRLAPLEEMQQRRDRRLTKECSRNRAICFDFPMEEFRVDRVSR